MKMYANPLSPYAMRATLTAWLKGLEIPVEFPAGGSRTDAFLRINPIGKTPVYEEGDFILPESTTIAEYLDETHPGPKILPEDPKARARARLLARICDLYLMPVIGDLFKADQDPVAGDAAKEKARTALGYIEHFRHASDHYLAGDKFTIADFALMPFFFFVEARAAAAGTGGLITDQPSLSAWWERAKATEVGSRMVREMTANLNAFLASQRAHP